MSEPVQVRSRKRNTNNNTTLEFIFSIWSFFFIAFASSLSTSGFKCFVPFIQLKIGVIRSRINGTFGITFPRIHNGIAFATGTPRSGPVTRSAPRSSRIGIMEITMPSPTLPLSASIIPCTNDCGPYTLLIFHLFLQLFRTRHIFFQNANCSIFSYDGNIICIARFSLPQNRT